MKTRLRLTSLMGNYESYWSGLIIAITIIISAVVIAIIISIIKLLLLLLSIVFDTLTTIAIITVLLLQFFDERFKSVTSLTTIFSPLGSQQWVAYFHSVLFPWFLAYHKHKINEVAAHYRLLYCHP